MIYTEQTMTLSKLV